MNDDRFDTSQYRKALWEKEYGMRKNLPSSITTKPSSALERFMRNYPDIDKEITIDLGSGNGRNILYLLENGFEKAIGVEFSKVAINQAMELAILRGFKDRAIFYEQSLNYPIVAREASIPLITDMMTMHSLTQRDRNIMADQVSRLLKPGGYFVFHTISTDCEQAQSLMEEIPGPESNSYRFKVEDDYVTEKVFTLGELKELFYPLELIEHDFIERYTPAFGDIYKRVYLYGVMQKPTKP